MRSEALLALVMFGACAPDVVIGNERRLTVVTTAPTADGRWRQAGFRVAATEDEASADLWYGTTAADGSLPAFSSPTLAGADAVRASTMVGAQFVVAGFITGDGGKRLAWVRALDETDGEVWTTTLPSPLGLSTEATAIAVTNEGSLIVAGVEQVSATDRQGFVALLEANGGVRWRQSFGTGFQGQVRGVLPLSIATEDGPASPSRRQFWVAGVRALATGTPGYVLQMTLDGDVWDSDPLGVSGSRSTGVVAAGRNGIVVCTSLDGAAQLAWTQGGAVSGAATTEVRPDEPFTLISCLGTTSQVKLVGTTSRNGAEVPTVITVDRASRAIVETQFSPQSQPVTVFGAAADASGVLRLVGRSESPLRRWSIVEPGR